VRRQAPNINPFVNDSLLDSYGAICKHLRDSIRSLFVSFEFAIVPVPKDVSIAADLVVVLRALRIFSDVIVVNSPLFIGPYLLIVGFIFEI